MTSIGRLFREYDFRPKKSRGQHFLVDQAVLDRIEKAVDCLEGDILLEVGGGYGALTERLLRKSRPLAVVEPDPKLYAMLQHRFRTASAFQLIRADILELDIGPLAPPPPGKITLAGNIPYYLTTPLITRLLAEYGKSLRGIFLMVQKEVADRLQAEPGSKAYGALTLCARYFSKVKVLFPVPSQSFQPRPKVESAFVSMVPKESLPLPPGPEKNLFHLVRAVFQSRRKTLRNSLKLLGMPPGVLDAALEKVGLRPDIRGETLDLDKMMELSRCLQR